MKKRTFLATLSLALAFVCLGSAAFANSVDYEESFEAYTAASDITAVATSAVSAPNINKR